MASLIDPERAEYHRIPKSNLIELPLDFLGLSIRNPLRGEDSRYTITNAFARDPTAMSLGLRFRCITSSGAVTFFCQRDVEVILNLAQPGEPIPWCPTERFYPPSADRWLGPYFETAESEDDLHLRECVLRYDTRAQAATPIPAGTTLTRTVIESGSAPYMQTFVLTADCDANGRGPDPSRERISRRWTIRETARLAAPCAGRCATRCTWFSGCVSSPTPRPSSSPTGLSC